MGGGAHMDEEECDHVYVEEPGWYWYRHSVLNWANLVLRGSSTLADSSTLLSARCMVVSL